VAKPKTFVEEWNGHKAFAHPLKFDELIHICLYNKLKFHILPRDGKMFRLSPGIKISIS